MPSHSVIQCQSNKHVSLTHKLYCGCVSHTGVPSELVNSLGVQIEFHPYVCILGNQTKAWNGGCSGIPDGKIRLCHRVTLGLSLLRAFPSSAGQGHGAHNNTISALVIAGKFWAKFYLVECVPNFSEKRVHIFLYQRI